MLKSSDDVDERLSALGARLSVATEESFDILVCGGSALLFQRLTNRATRDVDVLGLIRPGPTGALAVEAARPLPDALTKAAESVARDYNLEPSWINPGPTSILDFGLPEGMLERTVVKRFGPRLTVRFISRLDLIHLKLDAASEGPGKHYDDLRALNPAKEELRLAARWCVKNVDSSEGYVAQLKSLLVVLGHPDVAEGI
jgi:hypothetical protein